MAQTKRAEVTLGEQALKYASKGWAVLPLHDIEDGRCTCTKGGACRSPGKHPRTEHGVDEASTDAVLVSDWWAAWPTASIGLACGEQSGLFVLDVDAKAPKGSARALTGIEALQALEAQHGKLPETLEAATGGGGRHLYFQLPPGRIIKNRVSVKGAEGEATGLDVRSTGGYVVLPPSKHVTGGVYKWARPKQIVAAPDWLLDVIDPPKPKPKAPVDRPALSIAPSVLETGRNRKYALGALVGACRRVLASSEGERHKVLIREASVIGGYVVAGHLQHEEAYKDLIAAGLEVGKDVREVERTVFDGLEYGKDTPRSAPPSALILHDPLPDWKAPTPTDDDLGVDHREAVHFLLHHAKKGNAVVANLHNVVTILGSDPCYKGRLRRNVFSRRTEIDGHALEDADVIELRAQINTEYRVHFGAELAHDAAHHVAELDAYNPLRDYLDRLHWDDKARITSLLPVYFGSPSTPLNERYGARWMISAVARAYEPGCKVDNVLVLHGDQGSLKSSALKALVPNPEWFSDDIIDVQSKEGAISLLGKWIVEIGELESFRGKAQTAIKAFLSRAVDHYRPVHARETIDQPRSGILVASTNAQTFLLDTTGSRRFWVSQTGVIDIAGIRRDRDQLWAEAVVAYRSGEQWYLTREEEAERREVNESYQVAEPWEPTILTWLGTPEGRAASGGSGMTTTDVLRLAIGFDAARMTRQSEMIVADILRKAGCIRQHSTVNGVRAWRFHR